MCGSAETVALWVGVSLMSIGGLMIFCLLASLVMDYVWRKMREAYGLAEMIQAYRELRARKQKER